MSDKFEIGFGRSRSQRRIYFLTFFQRVDDLFLGILFFINMKFSFSNSFFYS